MTDNNIAGAPAAPKEPKAPNKPAHRVRKIVLAASASVLGLAAAVTIGFNVYLRATYADFYAHATAEMPIPGTNDGFVVQDADDMGDGTWLFSGYMADGSASPIYRRAADGSVTRLYVERPDGSVYDGHGGGITSDDDHVFLTQENGYLALPREAVEQAAQDATVKAVGERQLGIDPAFLTIEDGALFAGVFYKAGPYDTPASMHIVTPDGTENPAVMYVYERDGADELGYGEQPSRVFSIPGLVQGVCVLNDELVLSQSWGFNPSTLPVYDLDRVTLDGHYTVNGKDVPLYCLDGRNERGVVKAPPMSEGLVAKDGLVWFPNESASNKYLFGKLSGSWNVMAVDVDGYLSR